MSGVIAAPLHVEARAVARGARPGAPRSCAPAPVRGRPPSRVPTPSSSPASAARSRPRCAPATSSWRARCAPTVARCAPCPVRSCWPARCDGRGFRVHVGPLHSAEHSCTARRRLSLARDGALAVDLETYALVADAPVAQAVRVVVDTPDHPLLRPSTIVHGRRALFALTELTPVLEDWLVSVRPRIAVLAAPRSFCAGVERAIATVERALETAATPVYVRRQIVHNAHVVADLERRGAVFVQELDEVPAGDGRAVSARRRPAVRAEAAARGLTTIDATCPLVAKVHVEARRAADAARRSC